MRGLRQKGEISIRPWYLFEKNSFRILSLSSMSSTNLPVLSWISIFFEGFFRIRFTAANIKEYKLRIFLHIIIFAQKSTLKTLTLNVLFDINIPMKGQSIIIYLYQFFVIYFKKIILEICVFVCFIGGF